MAFGVPDGPGVGVGRAVGWAVGAAVAAGGGRRSWSVPPAQAARNALTPTAPVPCRNRRRVSDGPV